MWLKHPERPLCPGKARRERSRLQSWRCWQHEQRRGASAKVAEMRGDVESVVVPKIWISEMCPLFHRCLLLYLSILIYLSLLLALVILVLCSCCFCCLRRCFFFFWFRQLRNFVAQPNLCRLQRATPGYRTPAESHAIATPPEPVSEEKHNSQRGKILYQGLNYRDYKP